MEPADGEPAGASDFAPAKARWCFALETLIDEEPRSARRVAFLVVQRFSMIVRDMTGRPWDIDPRGTSVPSQERRPTLPRPTSPVPFRAFAMWFLKGSSEVLGGRVVC